MADRPGYPDDHRDNRSTDPANGPDDAVLAVAARHALHDEELIANLADEALAEGALEAADAARARALVERCPACRVLHADLIAIASAHRATAKMRVAAPRDFRIVVEQEGRAAGAAPAPLGLLDRLRAGLGSVGRPVGGTLVAAGLVGLLVGTVNLGAIPAGAPTSESDGTRNGAYASHEIVIQPQGPVPAPTAGDEVGHLGSDSAADRQANGGVMILAGSAALLVLGLAIVAGARRMRRPSG